MGVEGEGNTEGKNDGGKNIEEKNGKKKILGKI